MADERTQFAIRPVRADDAARMCAIYNHHVTATVVTFEEAPVRASEMGRRIRVARLPWLVVEDGGDLSGYARASAWKARASYRHTVECSVYVDPGFLRRGHGRRLYVALHEALGFAAAGTLPEVGRKFDRWIDVGYWTLLL